MYRDSQVEPEGSFMELVLPFHPGSEDQAEVPDFYKRTFGA